MTDDTLISGLLRSADGARGLLRDFVAADDDLQEHWADDLERILRAAAERLQSTRAALAAIAATEHEQRWDTPLLKCVCLPTCRPCAAARALEEP